MKNHKKEINALQSTNEAETINSKKLYSSFYSFCKSNSFLLLLLFFILLLTYGLRLFNYSISIDTEVFLADPKSYLKSFVSSGRFGLAFIKYIFNFTSFNPFYFNFLMVIGIYLFSIFWGYLIYRLSGSKSSVVSVLLFSTLFFTHPCFAEQFNFTLQGFEVSIGILFSAISLYLLTIWILNKCNTIFLFVGLFLMVWSFSIYQAIVPLFIAGEAACLILIFRNKAYNNFSMKKILKKYVLCFLLGLVIYYIIYKITIHFIAHSQYLSARITWGNIPVLKSLRNICSYFKTIVLNSSTPFYSPAYAFISIILIILACYTLKSSRDGKGIYLISTILLIVSPFLMSIVLGNNIDMRAQFSLPFVIAFGSWLIINSFSKQQIKTGLSIISLLLVIYQSSTTSKLFYTDYMRYQQDVTMSNKISYKIENMGFSDSPKVPVAVIGYHQTEFEKPTMEGGESLGASFFSWDAYSEYGCTQRILGFMKTLGYKYKLPDLQQMKKAKEFSNTLPSWPNKDSVQYDEKDDIIVIKLSDPVN